jgi:hypothetical protein
VGAANETPEFPRSVGVATRPRGGHGDLSPDQHMSGDNLAMRRKPPIESCETGFDQKPIYNSRVLVGNFTWGFPRKGIWGRNRGHKTCVFPHVYSGPDSIGISHT